MSCFIATKNLICVPFLQNTTQLLFCHRNGLWYGEGLGEDTINSNMLNNAKFVSMLEQVDEESNSTDSIVVSTMEKIHRVHSSADDDSLVS